MVKITENKYNPFHLIYIILKIIYYNESDLSLII